MKKRNLLLIAILLVSSFAFGQTFEPKIQKDVIGMINTHRANHGLGRVENQDSLQIETDKTVLFVASVFEDEAIHDGDLTDAVMSEECMEAVGTFTAINEGVYFGDTVEQIYEVFNEIFSDPTSYINVAQAKHLTVSVVKDYDDRYFAVVHMRQ